MTTASVQPNITKFRPDERKSNGACEENRWKNPPKCRYRHCKSYILGGILVVFILSNFLCPILILRCTDSHSPKEHAGNLSCLVSDAKQALECMSCNAPTLMKLPMSRDLLGHFIPDVGYVALLGCLNATSYCHDPELECCPDVEGKVSRNISLVGTSKQLHVKRHYEIFEFTKCKCQPRDKCIRRKDVIGKFVQEEVV